MDEIMDENLEAQDKKKKTEKSKSALFDWAEALVLSLALLVVIMVFFVRLISVDGSSMVPTLQDQDRIVVSNMFYTPEKGDIIVLTKKSFLPDPIVKRVIATQGDVIDYDYSTGVVSINGEVLQEDYINLTLDRAGVGNMEFPQTVPEGCIFVMGDNRAHSTDSRDARVGMVDTRYVQGHVLFRVSPLTSIGSVK